MIQLELDEIVKKRPSDNLKHVEVVIKEETLDEFEMSSDDVASLNTEFNIKTEPVDDKNECLSNIDGNVEVKSENIVANEAPAANIKNERIEEADEYFDPMNVYATQIDEKPPWPDSLENFMEQTPSHVSRDTNQLNEKESILFNNCEANSQEQNHNNSQSDKIYKCDFCPKTFVRKKNLNLHRVVHTDERKYSCDICFKTFKQWSHMYHHKLIHSNEKPFSCDVCNKKFRQKGSLTTHKRVHTDALVQHNLIHTGQKSHLDQHRRLHMGVKIYTCDVCEKAFSQKEELWRHYLIHQLSFKCDICEKTYNHKEALSRHNSSHLEKHRRLHTGKKIYTCDVCEKAFSQKKELSRHNIIHQLSYKCDECPRKFNNKRALTQHKQIHTCERPYSCSLCEKTFAQKTNLDMHTLIHANEEGHECDVCGRKFRHKTTLIQHRRIHTEEKPYICVTCGNAFISKILLDKHKFVHVANFVLIKLVPQDT